MRISSVVDLEVNTQRKQVLTKSAHVSWPKKKGRENCANGDAKKGLAQEAADETTSNKYDKVCKAGIVDAGVEKYNSSNPHGDATRNLLLAFDDDEAVIDWGGNGGIF